MKIWSRVKAAYKAFTQPHLVYEGEAIIKTAKELKKHNEVALLEYYMVGGYDTYQVKMLPPKDQYAVRRYLGYL